jgi:pyruvate/2-oxoglutarate/acetoin dehydrogenase E1 component
MAVYRRMLADSGIVVAGSNRVAADAVCVVLMKQYGASRVSDRPVLDHEQFVIGEGLGLGSPRLEDIDLRTSDPAGDAGFDDLVSAVEEELKG